MSTILQKSKSCFMILFSPTNQNKRFRPLIIEEKLQIYTNK